MTSNGIGTRVRAAREAVGMKQVELAAASGLSLGTIRNYEGGNTQPSTVQNLRQIADVLKVDLLWLIDGDRVGEEVA